MPRLARIVVPELPHHVTQRGNARRDVFLTQQDRQVYIGLLQEYSEHYSLRILGYCLMTNHVHLVVVPTHPDSLAKTLREVHGRYARYRNTIERGSGHLWQNRYYSCAFEWVRMASVMRYVELNPVRAGLVRVPEDYAWSSAISHLGGPNPGGLLDMDHWRQDWSVEIWERWLHDEIERIEEARAIRQATYGGRPFGSEQFLSSLEHQLERRVAPGKAGRPRKEAVRGAAG
jgi:putative transposase